VLSQRSGFEIQTTHPRPGHWGQGCHAYSASYAQSRLWFLHQLEPDHTAYHLPALWRLSGNLKLEALRLSLAGLVERHPTLRTSFCMEGSEVLQIIHPPAPFPLEAEPLADRNPDAVIEQWLEQQRTTPFDLTSGLLIRARLLAFDHQHHLLLLNHHHIASDGWSRSILARDLTELYNARCLGRAAELAPLRVHYHDYADWQRQRLSGKRLQTLKDYWIPQLTGLEPLELPTDHPRPATPSHQGASVAFQIEPSALDSFEQLCRSEGATLQMGLVAIISIMMHRYSHQDDIAIGIPHWGRNESGSRIKAARPFLGIIGFFVNTLVIRSRFNPQRSFRQCLQQIKETSLAAYDHHELPFEQMVEGLNLPRDTSRNPLVQVMLQLMQLPDASFEHLDDLEVQAIPIKSESAQFDLSFFLYRSADHGLKGSITYATDLFSSDRMERFCSHLLFLLSSALEAPDSPAASLCLLPLDERQLIESWQHGPIAAVPDTCVHQLFEQQAERTPDALALAFENEQISYFELNESANRLAHHLIDLGVGPEVIVAVCLEPSPASVVSLLAVLKAGGTYLPLEPHWPIERLKELVLDSGTSISLADSETTATAFRETIQSIILPLLDLSKSPSANPATARCAPSQLAYILYTSGSTGKPKGARVEHKTLNNLLHWSKHEERLSKPAKTLQYAANIFDVSLQEIFAALTTGGSLWLVSKITRRDFRQLYSLLLDTQIERIFMPYVALEQLSIYAAVQTARGRLNLRDIISAGEALILTEPIRKLLALLPDCRLHNHYGPTESHVVTAYCVEDLSSADNDEVSIGRPISNTIIYLLDSLGRPCPIGIPGELHIGGAGLARGYLNNPELTAEKFIPDPFSSDPTARLYKSGDLASWNPDGTLAFHGRIDQQIKLRGFRIEPGEIEAHLLAHPAVAQAVVLLRHDDPNNPRLIAYWVADASQPPTASASSEQLRSFLSERLPDYMVPAAFLQLETLPLTANGKLDRKALPAASFSGNLEQRLDPSTDRERQLHAIWAEVLGHSDFGITDNFFAIGGHSLLTMSVGQLVRDRLDLDVPVYWLFSHPTIRDLVRKLTDTNSSSVPGDESGLGPQGWEAPVVLPPPVQRALAQQRVFLERWPGKLAAGHQFVRMLGENKFGYRLFWCFQGSNEHESLARHLSPEVSVYGMRSLHATDDATMIYKTPGLLAILAGLYVREVIELSEAPAPLVVGGNCQAAWVGHAMAQQLVGCGYTVGRLVLMELRMQELEKGRLNWDGPVTLIWGKDSHHNPFSSAHRPSSRRLRVLKRLAPSVYVAVIRSRLQRVFTGELDISIVPGVHGAFFRSQNIEGLAAVVKGCVLNMA
jgi:amino acid adenylation domain-containing protein